jgi:hypothetical protein
MLSLHDLSVAVFFNDTSTRSIAIHLLDFRRSQNLFSFDATKRLIGWSSAGLGGDHPGRHPRIHSCVIDAASEPKSHELFR